MFMLKSMGKSSSIESMMNMSSMQSNMSNSMYLYDLKKTKTLTGTNAEIYKYFVIYMKERSIPITIKNLLDLLQFFSEKYTKQNSQNKFKKEIEVLSSKMLKEYMFDLFKNVGLSFGVSIYYLIKSQDIIKNFKENMSLKIGAIVLGVVVIVGITAYLYNTVKNRNYYSDAITSVNKLYDELNIKEKEFDIEQLVISVNSNELSADLFKSMLNNLDKIEASVPLEFIDPDEIIMEEVIITKTIDNINKNVNGDEDEIIEILLSPQEDKEEDKEEDKAENRIDDEIKQKTEEKEEKEEKNKETTIEDEPLQEPHNEEKIEDVEEKVLSEKKEPVKRGRKAAIPKTNNKKIQAKKPRKTNKK